MGAPRAGLDRLARAIVPPMKPGMIGGGLRAAVVALALVASWNGSAAAADVIIQPGTPSLSSGCSPFGIGFADDRRCWNPVEPRRWRIQHRHHGRLGGNHPDCRLRHRQPRDSHDVGDRRACGRGRDVRRGADDVRRLGRLCDPGHGRPHVQVFRQRPRRPARRASDRRPDRHRDRRAGQLHPFHRAGGRLLGKRAARRPGGRDDAGRAQRLAGGQWGGRNLLGRRAALQPARRSLRRCLGRHRLRRWRASPSQHLRSQRQARPEGDGGERRRSGDEPDVRGVQQHH